MKLGDNENRLILINFLSNFRRSISLMSIDKNIYACILISQ